MPRLQELCNIACLRYLVAAPVLWWIWIVRRIVVWKSVIVRIAVRVVPIGLVTVRVVGVRRICRIDRGTRYRNGRCCGGCRSSASDIDLSDRGSTGLVGSLQRTACQCLGCCSSLGDRCRLGKSDGCCSSHRPGCIGDRIRL